MCSNSIQNHKIIVITAPSGAGKTTIVRKLLAKLPFLSFSISATSRSKRHTEVDGVDYYFLSPESFQQHIQKDQFVEWEEVYPGRYYGTLHSELERIWNMNKIALFDIDVNGAQKIKARYGKDCLVIFIKPLSIEVLESRLRNRKTETEKDMKRRLDKAKWELGLEQEFDVAVVNDVLSEAVENCKLHILTFVDGINEHINHT